MKYWYVVHFGSVYAWVSGKNRTHISHVFHMVLIIFIYKEFSNILNVYQTFMKSIPRLYLERVKHFISNTVYISIKGHLRIIHASWLCLPPDSAYSARTVPSPSVKSDLIASNGLVYCFGWQYTLPNSLLYLRHCIQDLWLRLRQFPLQTHSPWHTSLNFDRSYHRAQLKPRLSKNPRYVRLFSTLQKALHFPKNITCNCLKYIFVKLRVSLLVPGMKQVVKEILYNDCGPCRNWNVVNLTRITPDCRNW